MRLTSWARRLGGDEDGVAGVDDDDVVEADDGDDPAAERRHQTGAVDRPHQLTGRPARTGRRRRRPGRSGRQRGEVADVVPAERAGYDRHPAGGSRGLGDGVVDRDPRQRRPRLLQRVRLGGERAQRGGELRVLQGQQVEQHRGPARRTCRRSSDSGPRRRTPRPASAAGFSTNSSTAKAPSWPGSGSPSRMYPKPVAGWVGSMPIVTSRPSRATAAASADPVAERVGVGDDVVGGEGAHDRVGVLPLQQRRRQADRGHRVARRRLGEHPARVELGQLGDHGVAMRPAGHDEEALARERRQPVEGGLDHRPARPRQVVQELRRALARQRPQPGPRATGGHHRPERLAHGRRG